MNNINTLVNGEIVLKHSGKLISIVNSHNPSARKLPIAGIFFKDESNKDSYTVFWSFLPVEIEGQDFHLTEYYKSEKSVKSKEPYKQYLRCGPALEREFFWEAC